LKWALTDRWNTDDDFNNLLGIISGYTELCLDLGETVSWEKLDGYLRQVQIAGERATGLVSQMLSFSRNSQIDNQPVYLDSLVRENVKMLRSTCPASIDFEIEIETGLPAVMMNVTQLNQIMMNLAVNARDAMRGSGSLVIFLGLTKGLDTESSVTHQPVRGDWVELSFKDNGCGIEPAKINDIFTPFYTNKDVGKGTGMGLSVIYGIMKACNGEILVESEVGKGSTFRMLFPPVAETDGETVDANTAVSSRELGRGEELLVVDDEQSLAIHVYG